MLRPFLLIGVGGSGGKTLRVVREDLVRRLAQAGWTGGLPQAWQFIHIDVPTHADGNDPDLPEQLPDADYQGLVASGVDYRTIDAALVQSGGEHLRDGIATWRPDPNRVNIPASKGAGQYRTLGRIITIAGLDRINGALQQARRSLSGAEVVGELAEATRVLGGKPSGKMPDPTVVVVSSIAGGSGSGAVVDVCDAVRAFPEKWADEIVGLLYAPDVFDYLPEEARRGVRPNSLAALAEILSGFWNSNGPSDSTNELFQRYGITVSAARRSGPRYPFLVGSRNKDVTYQTQNDIYRALGRSLASWVGSPALQDRITGYLQGNWSPSASSVPDRLPLHISGTETPFSALGSSRVGLGRDRFLDYASEHLARSAVERFADHHQRQRLAGDDRTESELVRDTSDTLFGGFLRYSHLDERGEDRNDVIDALRPMNQREDALALSREIETRVREGIPAKGEKVERVRQIVVHTVNDRSAAFLSAQREARYARARVWVGDIQEHLTSQAALQVSLHGAPVTAQLFHKLVAELASVREELQNEATQHRRWAASMVDEVAKAFNDPDGVTVMSTTDSIRSGVQRAVQTLHWQAEAEVRELAISLLPDLVENVIEPLVTAVKYSSESVSQERSSVVDGRRAAIAGWPEGDEVPIRLKAAPNEFLLDPTDDYPKILDQLVVRSVSSASSSEARQEAEVQILLGAVDGEGVRQTLVERSKDWVPRDHFVTSSVTAVPSRATFRINAKADQVLQRSSAWLTKEGTAVGRYMAEGLRDHLNPEEVSPAEHDRRLRRFEGQLVAALNAAAPLVSINSSVLVQVHNKHEPLSQTAFSEIPISEKSPAYGVVRRVLEGRGQWNEQVAQAFSDGRGGFVDIFTHLGEPYEPVVFDSLMRPIASDWAQKSKAADSRAEFWRWRRSRTLTEFLPMSPDVLDAMIRGWFVAGTLQHLELTETDAKIFVPAEVGTGGNLFAFPSPTLRNIELNGPEGLAVILESIVLALVDINTKESLDPIKAYTRLADLGGTSGSAGDDDLRSGELRRWILDGVNTKPGVTASSADQETRRENALLRFSQLETQYNAYFAKVANRAEMIEFPVSFDLRHQIIAALGDLRRFVEDIETSAGGIEGWA